MSKARVVSAVDIGSSKIACLIAQVELDSVTYETSVNILGAASNDSRGVKRGQIVDIEAAVESTIVAVEAAERMAGYNLDRAYISVGGGHITSQNSTGVVAVSSAKGEVSEVDVERVIEAARAISIPTSREVIHVVPRMFIVDGEGGVKDPIGMSGVRLEVDTHLVTASSPALKNLTKAVSEVGVNIDGIVFNGYASSMAVLTDTERELGCLLVDVGGGSTSVAVFIDGALSYSSTIPIGSVNVTNDLAIGLRVSLDSAERIKLTLSDPKKQKEESGSGKKDQIDISELGATESKKVSRRTVVEGIIRPRLNEIFTMVKLDLEKANLVNKIPSGAVITGGGALTVGAEDAAKRMLGLPIRLGKPGGVGGLIDDIITPSFATSIGLVLYGAGEAEPQQTDKPSLPDLSFLTKQIKKLREKLPF